MNKKKKRKEKKQKKQKGKREDRQKDLESDNQFLEIAKRCLFGPL